MDSNSSKVHRRDVFIGTAKIKPVIFTLFRCTSAEFIISAAAASRRRGKRPERQDQVPATHNEQHRGQRPEHHDQVPSTNNEWRRG